MDKQFEDFPPAPTTEVGGNHYMQLTIQPIQFSMALGVDALTFNVIKYLSRAPYKNGVEDYRKAVQYLEFLQFYKVQQRISPQWEHLLSVYVKENGINEYVGSAIKCTISGYYYIAIKIIGHIIEKSKK